jgi:MoaA/NifB/PqqE/SkfB family radical SAM enzyme
MCDHPHKPKHEMPLEIAHAILDQLIYPVRLTFIGGEPCLWLMRYPQILRRALDEGHIVHLVTNGILVPRLTDFVDAFRTLPVSVQFSIDGFEASYEQIRKGSRWDVLLDALRLLHRQRMEGKNQQAVITANYLLMHRTLDDLPRFVHFCAEEGIDAISLTYAMIYESMVDKEEITENESVYYHQQSTNKAVEKAIAIAKQLRISLSFPPPLGQPSILGRQWVGRKIASVSPRKAVVPQIEKLACGKPWKEIFVNQDGTIVPCCCGPKVGPVIGNIQEGLQQVWDSEEIKSVRKALTQGEFHKKCRCGINISSVGRQDELKHFFTRFRED